MFTNDHEIAPRALLLAAKKLNITSYYVQHASVSKYFPPLKFDYALLEGQDAKNKYLAIGKTNTKISLIGMPKLDKYVQWMNTKSKIESIGIAYNAMDNINLVKELINQLTGTFPDLKFVIRPHPSDKRTLKIQKVHLSNSRVENSFEFLNRIDALIASDSSIHLEAVLLNVFSMSYNFNDNRFLDYYGFVQNNLINHYSGKTNLIKKINSLRSNKPHVQNKAKYYNAAIESDFYGSSSSKAADIIIKTLNF
ncbi:hypothetical protein [Flagellimonas meridianipacifica]|uniref:hypothetical protein n=1 Tax=Flagellimonas meridianipacifica TaxID=1080225 RepID=UPI0011B295FF|nr:hypothetical protein [Allomuricauda pacifica]